MADEYSRKILTATLAEPVSAIDLSRECGIPLTTVYRRIEELVKAGLLAPVKAGRTPDGKWFELYRSILLEIHVSFESDGTKVDIRVNEPLADRFARMWTSIAESRSKAEANAKT